MKPRLEDHRVFWREMAGALEQGQTLLAALEGARAAMALKGSQQGLGPTVDALIQRVRRGERLSQAMEASGPVFGLAAPTMIKAGEIVGAIDRYARRISGGLEDGSLVPPGVEVPPGNEQARYWRALGRLLGSGVPILQTLDILGNEVATGRLREANDALRKGILDGQMLAPVLDRFPDVMPKEVVGAVAAGESEGELDRAAMKIADAIEAGDLTKLAARTAPADAKGAATATGPSDAEVDPLVVRSINQILMQASRDGASDIHFDAFEGGVGRIRVRMDGVLHEMQPLAPDVYRRVVARLKIISSLDVAEHRLPQDGRIFLKIDGKPLDVRISIVPALHGERVVLRLLPPGTAQIDLTRVVTAPDHLEKVRRLCDLPYGLVIANGPTGSGKTTLLYAMLDRENRATHCVMTIEDPVEYAFQGIAQIQVAPSVGLTFARALRSVLRQDPDAIMVGEIRDLETAHLVLQAAITGHLVLTTMHGSSAPEAVQRLIEVGVPPWLVSRGLAGVISQRLVRVLCPECRQKCHVGVETLPPDAAQAVRGLFDATFFEASPGGCPQCHGTGYRGRMAIHEILEVGGAVRQAIARGGTTAEVLEAASNAGMRSLLADGLLAAARGATSIEEVMRVVHV